VKPLELTVWARNENYPGASNVVYEHPDGLVAVGDLFVDAEAHEKRLTDAELAAEYWALYSEYVRGASNLLHCQERYMEAAGKSFQEADLKCRVLHRFATLPHFDEASL
jgi:hypothetical protein